MAIEEHLTMLRRGVRPWNAWREKQPDVAIDLSGGALRALDLTDADLADADLGAADLRGVILSGANLRRANLNGANLFKAAIDGAELDGADLTGVQFLNCAQLQSANNWQSASRDPELACGAEIPSRAPGTR